ncbi:DUF2867 domain-containing protein [Nocardia sp. NPDC127579]|uniref:DUF2867 domain-containing protein n=1 Tax=Nocardia sp. NPDC127579 TaxID=3345402 RepID=UPI00363FBE13
MKLPNSTYTARAWALADIAPDFRVEDVWMLPAGGSPDEFPELVRQIAAGEGAFEGERFAVLIYVARQKLGAWFGWDRPEHGLGTRAISLRERLPQDAGYERGPDQRGAPWTSVYCTDREWVTEYASRTVHALMLVGWVPEGGVHRGEMTVLVRPNGVLGRLYMAGIRPFRRLVVNPAFFRMVERNWDKSRADRRPGVQ